MAKNADSELANSKANFAKFRSKVADFTYTPMSSFLVNLHDLHDFRNFLKVSCVVTHILQRFDFVLLCWL